MNFCNCFIGNANLDPNDPTNADIVNLAKVIEFENVVE